MVLYPLSHLSHFHSFFCVLLLTATAAPSKTRVHRTPQLQGPRPHSAKPSSSSSTTPWYTSTARRRLRENNSPSSEKINTHLRRRSPQFTQLAASQVLACPSRSASHDWLENEGVENDAYGDSTSHCEGSFAKSAYATLSNAAEVYTKC